jgi:hypothetical protein
MSNYNAYHFTADRLRDHRPIPAIGETLVHTGPIFWCESGLYASRDAFDALRYAPGARLHRVFCEDIEREDETKLVCRRRTIVAAIDATDLLRGFACSCALDVIDQWDAPDVVRRYLETGDESLRLQAWDTSDAARDAAWAAARSAADAARSAAGAAAADAARSAARDAQRDAQRARFNAMVDAAFDG